MVYDAFTIVFEMNGVSVNTNTLLYLVYKIIIVIMLISTIFKPRITYDIRTLV